MQDLELAGFSFWNELYDAGYDINNKVYRIDFGWNPDEKSQQNVINVQTYFPDNLEISKLL